MDLLLVHGAWHGGWCWERLRPRLAALGHRTFAPTLSGLGERADIPARNVGLGTHVQDVLDAIEGSGSRELVLVGHSYGGLVITELAERGCDAVVALAYIDAFIPKAGQSMVDILGFQPESAYDAFAPMTAEMMGVNPADRDYVDAQLTPQPTKTYFDKVGRAEAYLQLPRSYIAASVAATPLFTQHYEEACINPGWYACRIEGGHDLMIDNPDELAQALHDFARTIAA